MIYGYCRCSMEKKQTCSNQHFAIQEYANHNALRIDRWVEENISSRKPLNKRALGTLMDKTVAGDTLIITEISRLGRNLYELAGILQNAVNKGVTIISIKENYQFKDDLYSKIMAYTFGLAAEIERDHISTRIKISLNKLKEQHIKLGRPVGAQAKALKLSKNQKKIKKLFDRGLSQAQITRQMNVHPTTLCRYLKRIGVENL